MDQLENQIKYNIIRKNVKRARIKVSFDMCVTAIVPFYYTANKIDKLIHEKSSWINKTVLRLKKNYKSIELSENEILLFGEKFKFEPNPSLKNKVMTYSNTKVIKSGHDLINNRELLVVWYKHLANKFIKQRVSEIANKNELDFNRLFIRDQKTKWGTCSSGRNLSFNWRLILCPKNVLDYLIVHELAHLNEMNHAARFWQTVAGLYPEYEKAKKWLKEYESFLFRY